MDMTKTYTERCAVALAKLPCCDKQCMFLGEGTMIHAVAVAQRCLDDVGRLSTKEKKAFLREKIASSCVEGVTAGNYLRITWSVGSGIHVIRGVCRLCFNNCYSIRSTYLYYLCKQVKMGIVNSSIDMGEHSAPARRDCLSKLMALCEENDISLTRTQLAALQIPNTVDSLNCYGWMQFYFDMVGDEIPNANEIHLEPTWIGDIYDEYIINMEMASFRYLGPTQFSNIWRVCFPHVCIREFKAVTGKCGTCAQLSNQRRILRDNSSRQYMTLLHMLHRSAYMGERMAYASRCNLACQQPKTYLSIISDGMAQNHCLLPWMGNVHQFPGGGLPQHMQGVLCHGRALIMFRTFHNIRNGANLQIHTFLLTLESILKSEGKLPDTIFHQVDGGSENVAKTMIMMCELLIIRGITKKIVLSRLLVGHTHADIDAVFGRLWKQLCTYFAHTQESYAHKIREALSTSKYDAEVHDIFVVPDYDAMFINHMDPQFGKYCKEEHSQLQFTFEAVGVCPDFPLGCKTTYRAYAENEVIEIVDDKTAPLQLRPRSVIVKTHPEKNDTQPEGFYLLRSIPDLRTVRPQGFKAGSREKFDAVLISIANYFKKDSDEFRAWSAWDKNCIPQSDCVQEHIAKQPKSLRIPFIAELFNNAPLDPAKVRPTMSGDRNYEKVFTGASVESSRSRPQNDPNVFPRIDTNGVGIPLQPKVRKERKKKNGSNKDADSSNAQRRQINQNSKRSQSNVERGSDSEEADKQPQKRKSVSRAKQVHKQPHAHKPNNVEHGSDSEEADTTSVHQQPQKRQHINAGKQKHKRNNAHQHASDSSSDSDSGDDGTQCKQNSEGEESFAASEHGSQQVEESDYFCDPDQQQLGDLFTKRDSGGWSIKLNNFSLTVDSFTGDSGSNSIDDDRRLMIANSAVLLTRALTFTKCIGEAAIPHLVEHEFRCIAVVVKLPSLEQYYRLYDSTISRKPPTDLNKLYHVKCSKISLNNISVVSLFSQGPVLVGHYMMRRSVVKKFGDTLYHGTVSSYNLNNNVYFIMFDDGDFEEWNLRELLLSLVDDAFWKTHTGKI